MLNRGVAIKFETLEYMLQTKANKKKIKINEITEKGASKRKVISGVSASSVTLFSRITFGCGGPLPSSGHRMCFTLNLIGLLLLRSRKEE